MRCGHINLARMTACFKCGLSLEKAPTAIPKGVDGEWEGGRRVREMSE